MIPTFNPRKNNSLSVSLAESVVFLRCVDGSTHRPAAAENGPPSMLRGLLILNLVRPTRISSISVELVGQSLTIWTEGPSTRYPTELEEKTTLYTATRTFFEAPRVPTGRRAISLEPGLAHYADEAEFLGHRRRPSSPSRARDPDHTYQFNPAELRRGRERARARPGADEYISQHDPPLEVHLHLMRSLGSPSPASSSDDDSAPTLRPPVHRFHTHPAHALSQSALAQRSSAVSPVPMVNSPYDGRLFSHSALPLPRPANSSRNSPQHGSPARGVRRESFDYHTVEPPRSSSRGRLHGRFSFAGVSSSILEAVRNVQGTSGERRHSRQGGERRDDGYSHSSPPPFSHVEEAVILDANEQSPDASGDGWQEFKKGTYTFPISFAIPSHVPPSMQCRFGSISWRLKAKVHRPGALTPKICASHEVILVASPSEDSRDDTDIVTIERFWGNQMHYMLSVSGRVFPIGGTIPMTLSLLPLEKVKIFKILVLLEERVEYSFAFSSKARRNDPERLVELLSLESRDEDTPLLPLPDVATPATEYTLQTLLKSDHDMSELIANLMGPGPWKLPMALTVPSTQGTLHFSNKNKRAPIEITHTLRVVVRVQRSDEREIDPRTRKLRKFDISLQTQVHILSPLSNAQHTILPCYSESLGAPPLPAVPRASFGNREDPRRRSHRSVILQSQPAAGASRPSAVPEGRSAEVDALYERNMMFERLITGQQTEDGILPPAYCAVAS